MPYQGRCNCGGINVALNQEERPESSVVCYCRNCAKAGGGGYSINYVIDEGDIDIQDPQSALKIYKDTNTASGKEIERNFCGNCGSPIMTAKTNLAGKAFVKASLFDDRTAPVMEVFTTNRESWQPAIEGAQQVGNPASA